MVKKALQKNLQLAQHARMVHRLSPEPDVSYEEILKPEYWGNVAHLFKGERDVRYTGGIIEIFPEDMSYYAELLVLAVYDTCIKVHPKFFMKIESDNGIIVPDHFRIKVSGDKSFGVYDGRNNGKKLKDGFGTEDEAKIWVADNLKTLV